MENTMAILRNSIRTPDGTVLISTNRHDYVTHVDANGETYMVDGGLDYQRGSLNKEKPEYLHLTSDSPHELLRTEVTWGTRGPDGTQELTYVPIANMSSNHLQAVLDNCNVYPQIAKVMQDEINRRIPEG
jgi:hypothetical protein